LCIIANWATEKAVAQVKMTRATVEVIIDVEVVTGGWGGLPKEGKWNITAKHYKQEIVWH
jgi:hypothetical protein